MAAPQFFQVMPMGAARQLLAARWQPQPKSEIVATADCLGRILAADTHSPEPVPAFRKSTVDGYALRARDTFGASQSLPAFLQVRGELQMGAAAEEALTVGEAWLIHTGGMLPDDADAVVMLEYTQRSLGDEIEVLRAVAPGENVIQAGEDVAAAALVLRRFQRLRPADIGGLLAVGISQIEVLRQPRVGILSCGDELVAPDTPLELGQVRDINAWMLGALAAEHGALPIQLGIVPDQRQAYQRMARKGHARSDILLLSAGSSVSARDYTRTVIDSLGAPGLLQHGLATKPGKPTIIAVCAGVPVLGLPGNPVSALLVARQLLPHLIAAWQGQEPPEPRRLRAKLTRRVASVSGREDWLPVRLHVDGDPPLAEPIFGKSNLIFTLVQADALLRVPLNTGGFDAGSAVDVEIL
ncbi:MAG: molybdopterin molybdotransferase MoeA [Chloroflexi bacterium]|nr:molybdopterin molybdotransferase MoeA [Chloroflexota bacterium]MCY3582627.1 molybdopterin molybdotransferase MoeA [Chloroflexota bacterium]MCY3715868.1 molybdopterin molybdotransferase MoeA [Chloroflexota bacterium]MDE2649863.1 molybdopterin molybdotransferase MoeA [Chloroflexota bacterium]